jgi:hypothetical protein
MNDNQRDDILWQIAKKRAGFKWSFSVYVFVNAFLIGVWYFSTGPGNYFWQFGQYSVGELEYYFNI